MNVWSEPSFFWLILECYSFRFSQGIGLIAMNADARMKIMETVKENNGKINLETYLSKVYYVDFNWIVCFSINTDNSKLLVLIAMKLFILFLCSYISRDGL